MILAPIVSQSQTHVRLVETSLLLYFKRSGLFREIAEMSIMINAYHINDAEPFRSLKKTTTITDHQIRICNSCFCKTLCFSQLTTSFCCMLSFGLLSFPHLARTLVLIILVFSFSPIPRCLTHERDIQTSKWKTAWCLVCKA